MYFGKMSWRISALVVLLACAVCAVRTQTTPAAKHSVGGGRGAPGLYGDGVMREKDVAVPMRDGVVLRADVLRPAVGGPFPTLLYRTPYDKEDALKTYRIFDKAVARGYAVVVQDVRGRFASDGTFRAYQNEGRDGYDSIEWAARQPWSTGAVGTFGLSYPGAVQWLAAVETPPHLKAMVPAMTFSTPREFFYFGGVFDRSWLEWILTDIAPDARVKQNLAGPKTDDEAQAVWKRDAQRIVNFLPLAALPDLRDVAPYYYDWLRHPPEDAWWEWAELKGKYSRVNAAALNLSGWYDEAYGPMGAAENFNGLIAARAGQSDARTQLLIGSWQHGVEETGETKTGELEFGPSAAINYDETVLGWMDRYVKAPGDAGAKVERPVRYFVMGRNEWREANAWPPAGSESVPVYLSASGAPKTHTPAGPAHSTISAVAGHGTLQWLPPSARENSAQFVSDPAHPVVDPFGDAYGAHDYRRLAARPDVLTYDSAPLARDFEITGPVTAEIYLSCDAPDMDLWVRLLDVAPDGAAFNLMSPGADVLRASYRDARSSGMSQGRELLVPGQIYALRLTRLITSNTFLHGHRLRVQIMASFSPHLSSNLQTGESEAVSAKMRKARIRIYSDVAYASRLLLPTPNALPIPAARRQGLK